MTGNTKLRGFGKNGRVQLERWGGTADVVLPQASTDLLIEACRSGLPKAPSTAEKPPYFTSAKFDQYDGMIDLRLIPEDAVNLLGFLRGMKKEWGASIEQLGVVDSVVSELELALKERTAWFDKQEEPGVDDEGVHL